MSERDASKVFFQPLPEVDNLNTAYFLAMIARDVTEDGVTGCWSWRLEESRKSYGRVWLNGKNIGLHRVIYTLCVGPVARRLEVCHTCDNPRCCNPAHLFVATHTKNMQDAAAKGRLKPPRLRGERHPLAKFTDEQIREIRRRYVSGQRGIGSILAKEFGTSPGTISDIVHRRKWSHVRDEQESGVAS